MPKEDEDPLLRSARREMKVAVGFWLVCAGWAVGLGKLLAYRKLQDGAGVDMVLGMPSWVFWVVILPWILATVFTLWFALRFMKDHDLLAESGKSGAGEPGEDNGVGKGRERRGG